MKTDKSPTEARVRELMLTAAVPGAAIATVRNGGLNVASMGVTEHGGTQAISDRTVFDAASLSKPIVAYAVLQLVDAGAFRLDDPLSKFVSWIVPGDRASASITARHVLTHTSGLPNLRGKDPLQIHFRPGAWFSYSSVGFSYLQSAVEAITSVPLEATMRRLVFEPLAMRTSSFEWHERFDSAFAHPHEGTARIDKHRPRVAEASYSLQTTAADYGSFVAAVLSGKALKEETHRQWLTPAAMVPKRDAVHLSNKAPETEQDVAWGLGWGLEPSRDTFFQWGKMPGLRAFVMGGVHDQSAVVLLTNSNRGLRLMDAVTRSVLPHQHPAIPWLEGCVTE